MFKDPSAAPNKIVEAGRKFVLQLYGSKTDQSLTQLRYQIFAKSLSKINFNLASLPPTEAALQFHSFRAYHQIQKWMGIELNATDWGWKLTSNGLAPIPTNKEPAPTELLHMISCKCLKGCTKSCSCRKAGLMCSVICEHCCGMSCLNSETIPEQEESDDAIDNQLLEFFSMDKQ